MNNKKITKKDMFKMIIANCGENDEIVKFCQKEIELLNKKRTYKSPKDVAKEKENKIIEKLLLEVLDENPKTIKELFTLSNELSNYSSQKISSVIKTLDNIEIEKDRTYKYFIAEKKTIH